jgi:hypothetical protein
MEGIYKYIIEGSVDNVNWTTVVDKRNNTNPNSTQNSNLSSNNVRYIRITITENPSWYWSSFYEFEVYGTQSVAVGVNKVSDKKLGLKVYPNPVINSSTVEYNLDSPAEVNIELYNVKGQKLDVLESRFKNKGLHKLELLKQICARKLLYPTCLWLL